jgi:hypothetical protein
MRTTTTKKESFSYYIITIKYCDIVVQKMIRRIMNYEFFAF